MTVTGPGWLLSHPTGRCSCLWDTGQALPVLCPAVPGGGAVVVTAQTHGSNPPAPMSQPLSLACDLTFLCLSFQLLKKGEIIVPTPSLFPGANRHRQLIFSQSRRPDVHDQGGARPGSLCRLRGGSCLARGLRVVATSLAFPDLWPPHSMSASGPHSALCVCPLLPGRALGCGT